MTDIHCHILDGLDDGADSLSESVLMARTAFESGTHIIVATPHANIPGSYDNFWDEELEAKLEKLNAELIKERIDVRVLRGQEVYCDGDVVEMLKNGDLVTINDTKYVLSEFGFYERRSKLVGMCDELCSEGYIPVIAHPERYECLQEDDETVYRIKEMGCLFQLNKGSLMGAFGKGAYDTAHYFMSEALADFIASDAHSPYMRTTFMADAHEMVCDMYSPDYADFLFRENPGLLVSGAEINSF